MEKNTAAGGVASITTNGEHMCTLRMCYANYGKIADCVWFSWRHCYIRGKSKKLEKMRQNTSALSSPGIKVIGIFIAIRLACVNAGERDKP